LFEGVEAGFGGEERVEVFGKALPVGGEFGGVGALGERAEQGVDELGMCRLASADFLLQVVAEGHQFIDFGDDAVLFGEGW